MSQNVLSITQINEYLRTMMDRDDLLCNMAVRGEISNYKVYPSGHHYFTLKDEGGALKAVMFRSSAVKLRFRPENGMQVIAFGKISVYARDGVYQLYCSNMMLDGAGDLHTAFEQLKAKLAVQGLFDPAHKKKLPAYPKKICIITSPSGAAIHDMLRILRKRYPITSVVLLPVRVQGAEAPAEIANAIRYANDHNLADLLITGRGGGSIEDLWAFNEEIVARAIYDSTIPVISAVGHEPDVTISDYVADLRAATPSNAAELAVPDQNALKQNIDAMLSAMTIAVSQQIKRYGQKLHMLRSAQTLQTPAKYIKLRRDALNFITSRLLSLQQNQIHLKKQKFISLTVKLDAMSPLKVLTRGYALLQTQDNTVIRSVGQVHAGDVVTVTLSDGTVTATINDESEVL